MGDVGCEQVMGNIFFGEKWMINVLFKMLKIEVESGQNVFDLIIASPYNPTKVDEALYCKVI